MLMFVNRIGIYIEAKIVLHFVRRGEAAIDSKVHSSRKSPRLVVAEDDKTWQSRIIRNC